MTKPRRSLDDEALTLVATRFRVLGDPLRLRILQTLDAGEISVSELAAEVESTQPNVSKHLRILQEAGFVGRRQQGNTVYCFIADKNVFKLCDLVCGSLHEHHTAHARIVRPVKRRG